MSSKERRKLRFWRNFRTWFGGVKRTNKRIRYYRRYPPKRTYIDDELTYRIANDIWYSIVPSTRYMPQGR